MKTVKLFIAVTYKIPPWLHDRSAISYHSITMNFLNRIRALWKLGFFDLTDASGNTIDIEETFTPKPKVPLLLVKLGLLVWCIQVIANDISRSPQPSHWLIFLTNWQSLLILGYLICSFVIMIPVVSAQVSIDVVEDDPKNYTEEQQIAILMIRIMWFYYSLSLNVGLIASIMFWILVYDGSLDNMYSEVMKHGGLFMMVFIDGMIINRIPLRLKQVIWTVTMGVSYWIWLVIHQFSGIGNPYRDDIDRIYEIVDFEETPLFSCILCFGLSVVVMPFLFAVLMTVSSFISPRYTTASVSSGEGKGFEREETFDDDDPEATA